MLGTSHKDLVRELGHNRPQTNDKLMDVVANYVASDEAVGVFFGHKGKAPVDDDESPSIGSKKNNNKKKKARQNKCEAIDDDFIVVVERKKPRGPPEGVIFDKRLKEPCPYHMGGNHKFEDCRMLKITSTTWA